MIEIDRLPDSYSQGLVVEEPRRLVFVSGQVPAEAGSPPPPDFADQCRLAWANVLGVLAKAGMAKENLVKVTVFLSDRRYREDNAKVRQEVLGDHSPALTIIITGIYDDDWLLEIEAVAAD